MFVKFELSRLFPQDEGLKTTVLLRNCCRTPLDNNFVVVG